MAGQLACGVRKLLPERTFHFGNVFNFTVLKFSGIMPFEVRIIRNALITEVTVRRMSSILPHYSLSISPNIFTRLQAAPR